MYLKAAALRDAMDAPDLEGLDAAIARAKAVPAVGEKLLGEANVEQSFGIMVRQWQASARVPVTAVRASEPSSTPPSPGGYLDADMHETAVMEGGAAAKTRRKLVLPPRGNGYSYF